MMQSLNEQMLTLNPVFFKGRFDICGYEWYYENIKSGYDRFYFIVDGEGTIIINDVTYTAKPGQLFLIPYSAVVSLYTEKDRTLSKYWFHCLLPCQQNDLTDLAQLPAYITVSQEEIASIEKLFKDIYECAERHNVPSMLNIKAGIHNLTAYFLDKAESAERRSYQNERVAQVIKYIEDHLKDKITLEKLSKIVHLHPNYLVRYFKIVTGQSPIAYVTHMRIKMAERLLLKDGTTISEVCTQVGFNNPHYFERQFKKYVGLIPTEYQLLAIVKHTDHGISYLKRSLRPSNAPPEKQPQKSKVTNLKR